MFEHFEAAVVKPGVVRCIRLAMLPGTPTIEVEYIGETNETWMSECASRAGKNPVQIPGTGPGGTQTAIERQQQLLRYREILAKHGVRHLPDVRRADGTPAEDADIPKFCAQLPPDIVMRLFMYVFEPDNFRGDYLPPEDLAGKF